MQKKKKGEWEINNKEFRKQDSLALRAKFHDGDLQAKPLNQCVIRQQTPFRGRL